MWLAGKFFTMEEVQSRDTRCTISPLTSRGRALHFRPTSRLTLSRTFCVVIRTRPTSRLTMTSALAKHRPVLEPAFLGKVSTIEKFTHYYQDQTIDLTVGLFQLPSRRTCKASSSRTQLPLSFYFLPGNTEVVPSRLSASSTKPTPRKNGYAMATRFQAMPKASPFPTWNPRKPTE